jgi:hypothetical protein
MPMKPTLLVLAAGMGSRYGGIKQIDPVGPSDEAIIDYSIYDAIQAGFHRVVFVVRQEIEHDIRDFFAGKFEDRLETDYVLQDLRDMPEGFSVPDGRKKPWGTAHAVLAARGAIDAPFAVINGDDFYGRVALQQMADYLRAQSSNSTDYAMAGYRLDTTLSDHGTVSRGIVEQDGDWLKRIEEHTKLVNEGDRVVSYNDSGEVRRIFEGSEPASMNLFGFTPAVMAQFEEQFTAFLSEAPDPAKVEFFIPVALAGLIEADCARCKVIPTDSEWFGVTYREDRPRVVARLRELVNAGVYPRSLWTQNE